MSGDDNQVHSCSFPLWIFQFIGAKYGPSQASYIDAGFLLYTEIVPPLETNSLSFFLLPSPHHFDRIPFLTFVTEYQSSVCCLNYDTYHSYLRSSEPDAGNIEWNRQMPGGHLDNRQVRFVHKVDED